MPASVGSSTERVSIKTKDLPISRLGTESSRHRIAVLSLSAMGQTRKWSERSKLDGSLKQTPPGAVSDKTTLIDELEKRSPWRASARSMALVAVCWALRPAPIRLAMPDKVGWLWRRS
jgi:hypothetical protein